MSLAGINAYSVHAETHLEGGQHHCSDARHSNYVLVQFTGPLDRMQYDEINNLDLYTLQYLAGNTYLCRYNPDDLDVLRKLPYVVYATVYHTDFVVRSDLKEKVDEDLRNWSTEPAPIYHVAIVLHSDDLTEAAVKEIANVLHFEMNHFEAEAEGQGKIVATYLDAKQICSLVSLDAVASIEEIVPLHPQLFRAPQDIGYPRDRTGRNGPIAFRTYTGLNQIIAVADNGLNGGYRRVNKPTAANPLDYKLDQVGKDNDAFTGRVLALVPLARQNRIADTVKCSGDADILIRLITNDAESSHGTHVAGCAVGNGSALLYGSLKGTAPAASLVMYSLLNDNGVLGAPGTPATLAAPAIPFLRGILNRAYIHAHPARIHNNSNGPRWGGDPPSGYTQSDGGGPDDFVWEHQDMLIIVAAGNYAVDTVTQYGMIEGMALSKNALTVGACQSSHKMDWGRPDNRSRNHLQYSRNGTRGNPSTIAYFSNCGPAYARNAAVDQAPFRWKPDLVAPGLAIFSAQAKGTAGIGKKFGNSWSTDYMYNSGTSMAAPMVAGAAALVREAVIAGGALLPVIPGGAVPLVTASLLKAILINTTDDLHDATVLLEPAPNLLPGPVLPALNYPPRAGNPPLVPPIPAIPYPAPVCNPAPDRAQGFGRINVARALDSVANGWRHDNIPITAIHPAAGSFYHTTTVVPAPGLTRLMVTMCYADPGGAALHNVLSLQCTSPVADVSGVTVRHGNDMAVNVTGAVGPSGVPDTRNNVQKIFWSPMPVGAAITIEVRCTQYSNPVAPRALTFALVHYFE